MSLDEIYVVAIEAGFLISLALPFALLSPGRFRPLWLLGAVAVFVGYDFFLSRGFWSIPDPLPEGASWNWSGKILAIVFTVTVASLPFVGWKRAGLTVRQNRGSWTAWLVFVVIASLLVYAATLDGIAQADAETIAFQWTMPGLDEELLYRGVLLLMLNEAFRGRINILGAPMGWAAVVTSLLFAAIHGIDVEDGVVDITVLGVWSQALGGLILVWMRERTGSVILPVLAHNWVNGIFTVI